MGNDGVADRPIFGQSLMASVCAYCVVHWTAFTRKPKRQNPQILHLLSREESRIFCRNEVPEDQLNASETLSQLRTVFFRKGTDVENDEWDRIESTLV